MRTREQNREYINKRRFREKVNSMREKGIICEVCYNRLANTLHHKDEDRNNNRNTNLKPVCHQCHLEIKHKKEIDFGKSTKMPHKRIEMPHNEVLQVKKQNRIYLNLDKTVTFFRKLKPYIVIRCVDANQCRLVLEDLGYKEIEI